MKFPRLFGRADVPSVKESAAAYTHVMTPGQPVWSPRDYAAFADEAYRRNVIAYQAVNRICDAVASVRWLAFRGEQELIAHPLLELIAQPNPMQSGAEYIRAKVGYYLLAGNGYEERVTVAGQARELYQLRPDRMQIIPAANGLPEYYCYKVGGKKVIYGRSPSGGFDLRHMKAFNPVNDWYGQSPVESGAYAIDQHNEAMKYMQALLQNSARPSGALVASGDTVLGDDAFQRLKAEVQDQYSGSHNAGRPMILEGGLTWHEMGLSPTDMGIQEAKNSAARDIALAFGVPPQMLGIPGDNTYSNYKEARLAFWEDTVIPLVDLIAQDWSAWLGKSQGIRIKADYDQVPAIVDKRSALWDMANMSDDLTINERREMKGYDPIEGGDVVLVQSSQISLSMASEPILTEDISPALAKALAYGHDVK
jgi:HK97 family phage portal protein